MAVTGKQIAETALQAYQCKGGYIFGKTGQTWTQARQTALEKAYNANPEKNKNYKLSAQLGAKWIGHRVWDCAGLCNWASKENGISIHLGSNLIWRNDLAKKGALTAGMELPVGALVFTGKTENDHPHIGVYTGNGKVTEASGVKAGVVQSNLSASKWTWWGLEKGVTYDFIPGESGKPAEGSTSKLPTLQNGNKGTYVKKAQQMLKDRGYDLGICGVDGDFGPATEKAVRKFQQDWGMPVTGIINQATWEKLESTPVKEKTYTVTIRGLSQDKAKKLLADYPNSTMKEE